MNNNQTRQSNTIRNNNTSKQSNTIENNNSNNTRLVSNLNNNKSMLNIIKAQTSNLSPITIFIIVLILLILIYIAINYLYSQIASSSPVKVSQNVLLDVVTDGMSELEIGSSQLPNSSYSNEYSLSLWVYVDNFDYKHGERKVILRRGDITSVVNPEIYIHPTQNKLQVNISLATDSHGTPIANTTTSDNTTTTDEETFLVVESFDDNELSKIHNPREFEERAISSVSDDKFIHNIANNYDNKFFNSVVNTNKIDYLSVPSTIKTLKHNQELDIVLEQFGNTDSECVCDGTTRTGETETERQAFEEKCGKCFVENFPLQKWVHLVISQYNNVIDIYVDGKLNSSCVLQGFPDVSTGNLVLSPDGGYSGQMSSVVYFNSAMSQDDVYKVYSKGPNGARVSSLMDKLKSIPTWIYLISFIIILVLVGYSFVM
jgi:hypothetical protein